jgi:predicted RNase H-like HicB family nuclease
MKYAVVFEKAPRNWCAYIPDLPGCVSTGGTFAEVQANIREAIQLYLDGMKEDGDKPPRASTRVGYVEA